MVHHFRPYLISCSQVKFVLFLFILRVMPPKRRKTVRRARLASNLFSPEHYFPSSRGRRAVSPQPSESDNSQTSETTLARHLFAPPTSREIREELRFDEMASRPYVPQIPASYSYSDGYPSGYQRGPLPAPSLITDPEALKAVIWLPPPPSFVSQFSSPAQNREAPARELPFIREVVYVSSGDSSEKCANGKEKRKRKRR